MRFFTSERVTAIILLCAAALGLVLANSPAGPALFHLQHAHFGFGTTQLSPNEWISNGLLAIFFFTAAVELKHEIVAGELNSVSKALHPAIAAVCGVVAPALIYLLFTAGTELSRGWPIPTATDIAFALGVLAVFGTGLPRAVRVFLLALAVLDDLIAIIIIAVFFTTNPNIVDLGAAAITLTLFGLLSRKLSRTNRWSLGPIVVVLALATWWFVEDSGVHATIAGVALGLVMARGPAGQVRHALEPWTNIVILPLFAFSAAMVAVPSVSPTELTGAFWGVFLGLPAGKIIGISVGSWIGSLTRPRAQRRRFTMLGTLSIGALGGIGFTVSLLMNELAFSPGSLVQREGTLAVLLGSGLAIVVASVLVTLYARRERTRPPLAGPGRAPLRVPQPRQ